MRLTSLGLKLLPIKTYRSQLKTERATGTECKYVNKQRWWRAARSIAALFISIDPKDRTQLSLSIGSEGGGGVNTGRRRTKLPKTSFNHRQYLNLKASNPFSLKLMSNVVSELYFESPFEDVDISIADVKGGASTCQHRASANETHWLWVENPKPNDNVTAFGGGVCAEKTGWLTVENKTGKYFKVWLKWADEPDGRLCWVFTRPSDKEPAENVKKKSLRKKTQTVIGRTFCLLPKPNPVAVAPPLSRQSPRIGPVRLWPDEN